LQPSGPESSGSSTEESATAPSATFLGEQGSTASLTVEERIAAGAHKYSNAGWMPVHA